MLVGDHPLAVDLAVANGRPHPDIAFFPIRPFSLIRLRLWEKAMSSPVVTLRSRIS
jgi:hypothetical protein